MIFFVHVGKTAGSTLNRYLSDAAPGLGHCEAFIHDPAALATQLATAPRWLSGHVSLPVARRRLAPHLPAIPGGVRYYTCMRRPAAQVRSHYNWLIEIFHKPGDFYDRHPAQIRVISKTIRDTVAAPTPAGIAEDLRRFAGLFLNCQSRYFFGPGLETLPKADDPEAFAALPQVRAAIASFDAISDSDAIEALAGHILGRPAPRRRTENASRYHFDPALFETDEVQETLRRLNRVDELLYAHLAARMRGGLLVNREPAAAPLARPEPGGALHG